MAHFPNSLLLNIYNLLSQLYALAKFQLHMAVSVTVLSIALVSHVWVLLFISLANTLSMKGLHYDSYFMCRLIFKLFCQADYPVGVKTNRNFQNCA